MKTNTNTNSNINTNTNTNITINSNSNINTNVTIDTNKLLILILASPLTGSKRGVARPKTAKDSLQEPERGGVPPPKGVLSGLGQPARASKRGRLITWRTSDLKLGWHRRLRPDWFTVPLQS